MATGQSRQALDTSLLRGLRYSCLPGCGLCCFAEPLVAPTEKEGLLRLIPEAEFFARGGFEFVRSRPNGGACQLLAEHRCTAHSARPEPCREYPLTGYVGTRIQVVAALTCPGIDLTFLDGYRGPETAAPPWGLDAELSSLRAQLSGNIERRLDESGRRRRRIFRALATTGRWVDEEEVRRQLRGHLPIPADDDFPATDPPSREEGLELLPLVFDRRGGPVAFATRPEGWELIELRSKGGVERSLGVTSPPDRLPALSEEAVRLLAGYLRYWLERDQLFGVVHLEMAENDRDTVTDWVVSELRQIAALTIARASVLAVLSRGGAGSLTGADLQQGIRATDQDLLDRPSWGTPL